MPNTPPTEILEHIIDLVASNTDASRIYALLSLCLCCKALVPRSQKHIFRDVTLYPPVDDSRASQWGLPVWSKHYQQTSLFVQTVAEQPHLGRHVQALTCTFTEQWLSTDNAIVSAADNAFRSMENVERLTLAHSQPNARFDFGLHSVSSSIWVKAITSLLQYSQVQQLSIHGLTVFPGEAILRSSHLRHLNLLNCRIGFIEPADELPELLRHLPRLQSLACDHYSLTQGIDRILSHLSLGGRSGPANPNKPCDFISDVEDLKMDTGYVGMVQFGSILQQTKCLKHLHLTLRCDDDPDFPSLLGNLNSQSFDTLSHLTVRIFASLHTRDGEVRTPYGCSWSDILPRLKVLEFLEFFIVFQGEFEVDPSSFGDQWGEMPGVFASGKHHFPNLREVKTTVHVRLIEDEFMEERDKADAGEFRRNIENLVYPRHFLPLETLRSKGHQVDYSFKLESSAGPEW